MGNWGTKEEKVVIAQAGATAGIQDSAVWHVMGWILLATLIFLIFAYCAFRRCTRKAEEWFLKKMGGIQTQAFESFYASRFSFRKNRDREAPTAATSRDEKPPTKIEIY